MQWKIARPGAFAEWLHHFGIRRGFPALAWIAPRLPRWFLLAGARVVIFVVMFVHPAPKKAIARNLARILGAPAESRRVRRAVRDLLHHFAYSWLDLFRFAQLPAERAEALIVGGDRAALDPVRQAMARGERLILMTAHLGNWELGGVILGKEDLPVAIVYVPDQFEVAEQFRALLRGMGNLTEIPIRPDSQLASLPVLRAFSEGRMVALQGDRDFNDRGQLFDFFGAPASFPTGPFHLARMTGAKIWPTFIVYAADLRFVVEYGEAIEVERGGDRDAAVRAAMARWVAILEDAVRRHPTQWHAFYDFWPDEPAADAEPAIAAAGGAAR
jgi:KDO2-lipid IV(A) lauroyltransferase